MIIATVRAYNIDSIEQQMERALAYAEGIELRLDDWQLADIDCAVLAASLNKSLNKYLNKKYALPYIFTLRKQSQGGHYRYDETKRLRSIFELCALQPEYIDIEYDVDHDFVHLIKKKYPHIKLICSYHDFTLSPTNLNLDAILQSMYQPFFDSYKIVTSARSTLDALKMLHFVRKNCHNINLTGICMGEYGICTRILGPIMGNTFTYASISNHQQTAAGQLPLQDLIETYHVNRLNQSTKIYAVLGDPVNKSVGYILHNSAIRFLNRNAVYLKLQVVESQLQQTIKLCRQLPFAGFSITMPLKESIIQHIDDINEEANAIKAVNTIVVAPQQKWIGYNTDGRGAMLALNQKLNVRNQTIIILGAGGAARAIAFAAKKFYAKIIIINRTAMRAIKLAHELQCDTADFNQISTLNYDIIVNTIPINTIKKEYLRSGTTAMDIVYQPIETEFLKIAMSANCVCIPGYKMYIQQALQQLKLWFQPNQAELNHLADQMLMYFASTSFTSSTSSSS